MPTSTSTRTIRVLIVDDHAGYQAIAAEVVAAAPGHQLAGLASDAQQALRLLETCPVDLVLMDVNLGADDGIALTQLVTERADTLAVVPDIVLVTTLAFEDLPRSARVCGARGYLPKAEVSPQALNALRVGVYDWPDDNTTGCAGR